MRAATEDEIGGGDAWRVYDYVARHFLGSISPDCVMRKTKAMFAVGGETFTSSGTVVLKPGFTSVMPWKVGDQFTDAWGVALFVTSAFVVLTNWLHLHQVVLLLG